MLNAKSLGNALKVSDRKSQKEKSASREKGN